MKVFLGYGYNDRDKWIPEKIIPFIESLGHTCLTGNKMQGERLSEGVHSRIIDSDVLIGFLTRRDRIDKKGIYTTHKWVTDEIALAAGIEMPFFEIREKGIESQQGFTGDRQYFELVDIEDISKVCEQIQFFLENSQKSILKNKRRKSQKKLGNALGILLLLCALITIIIFSTNDKDSDGDGIADKNDNCPNIVGVTALKGCPYPDSDGDGVADKDDDCPKIAGVRELKGCNPKVITKVVDTVLTGTLEFHQNPNLEFDLSILPYYMDGDTKNIEPISKITESNFEAKTKIRQKEIGISVHGKQDELKDWVISSSGVRSIPYAPDQKLVFRKKDDYYYIQKELIEGDIMNNYPKINVLSELDWVKENNTKWYSLKQMAMDHLYDSDNCDLLALLCESIIEHTNFENLQPSQKIYVFKMWAKAVRKLIEDEFDSYSDETYENIGQVAVLVIDQNSEIKGQLRLLINSYNKHHDDETLDFSEEVLNDFLNE